MDVPEKYRVSRFFQNTTDYKGERLTKKDVLRVLFLAFSDPWTDIFCKCAYLFGAIRFFITCSCIFLE